MQSKERCLMNTALSPAKFPIRYSIEPPVSCKIPDTIIPLSRLSFP